MTKTDSIDNYRRNLIVAGKAPRTVKSYCRSVRQLMEHYQCDPAALTEKQVRDYLVPCRDVKGWNHWTLKIALTSLKFYYTHGDGTSWNIWDFAKPPRYKPEITVLTMREVRAVIGQIQLTHLRVAVSPCNSSIPSSPSETTDHGDLRQLPSPQANTNSTGESKT